METILFVLDGVLVATVCFMALRDDRRPRGAPATSLFRFRDVLGPRPVVRRFVPGNYRPDPVADARRNSRP